MKKTFCIIIAFFTLIFSFSACGVSGGSDSGVSGDIPYESLVVSETYSGRITAGVVYKYNEESSSYSITGYNGADPIVYVTKEYDDGEHGACPVTRVEASAFAGKSHVIKIILPETVNYLGKWCFANCPNLTTIFMDGVKQVGDGTAWNMTYKCDSLKIAVVNAELVMNRRIFWHSDPTQNPDGTYNSFLTNQVDLYVNGADENIKSIGDNSFLTYKYYFYSKTKPSDTSKKWWHLDDLGNITLW